MLIPDPDPTFCDFVRASLGDTLVSDSHTFGQFSVTILGDTVVQSLAYLRDHPDLALSQLVDITAVDTPAEEPRFTVVYHLLSMRKNQRLRVKARVSDGQSLPSVTEVFACANWYEREVWDMFGIPFTHHPDLRRILTDYGFDGHPLRKDFPLTGFTEVRYDETQGRVVYEPVVLQQDYRAFETLSPWESLQSLPEN